MIFWIASFALIALVVYLPRHAEKDYLKWSRSPEGIANRKRIEARDAGKPYEPKNRTVF